MLKIAEFAYIISMFISVAGFAVHLTVRFKDLSATSSLAKQTSTTFFLLFILIFNISDYVIIYFGKSLGVEYVDWLYAFQNVMEVVLVYALICMETEYSESKLPRAVDFIMAAVIMALVYFDVVLDWKSTADENLYFSLMIVINAIPIVILAVCSVVYIRRCIENEVNRQKDIIESGEKVIQETRRWDDEKGVSYPMRSKEDAQDYRYFPDPDLVPIIVSDEWIAEIKAAQPEFKDEKKVRYKEMYGLPDYDIDQITGERKLGEIFEGAVAAGADPKKASNWLMVETQRLMKEHNLDADGLKFSAENLAKLINLVESKEINNAVAKEVFEKAVFLDNLDPVKYVADNNLSTKADSGELEAVVKKAIEANPKAVEDIKNGKGKAVGAIVGYVMKEMKGKCDPAEANRLIAAELANL